MKRIISTKKAPQPIGPYSQAILVGNTLYTSGQIALNPETGELVMDTIQEETTQVMENLKSVLEAAFHTISHPFLQCVGYHRAARTVRRRRNVSFVSTTLNCDY